MYLFLDTETAEPQNQRVCQLAAVLCDAEGRELDAFATLIKPDGWFICDRFIGIHGITTGECFEHGIPMVDAMSRVNIMAKRAMTGVCHNYAFDSKRVEEECQRYHIEPVFLSLKPRCTMLETTPILQLPKARGSGYKWPKLQEAYRHFFGVEFPGDHDALVDTRATARVFFHMNAPKVPSPAETVVSAVAEVKPDELTGQAPI